MKPCESEDIRALLNETHLPATEFSQVFTMEDSDVGPLYRQRSPFAHKGTMGHALLVCGRRGMAGASILAAEACLRSGIGKLSIHTPAINVPILQTTVPEAIILEDERPDCISQAKDTADYACVGLGSGIGTDDATASATKLYLQHLSHPMVLDADGLNLLALHPEWRGLIPDGSILTPHVGEVERIVGHSRDAFDRLQRVMDLAHETRSYVVLKGHRSAVCSPKGPVYFCQAGNAGMATAGSGDVLTGVLTGLLAQGYPSEDAARLGVWLHATAGDFAARELGENCMLARDIIRHLPDAFRQLTDN